MNNEQVKIEPLSDEALKSCPCPIEFRMALERYLRFCNRAIDHSLDMVLDVDKTVERAKLILDDPKTPDWMRNDITKLLNNFADRREVVKRLFQEASDNRKILKDTIERLNQIHNLK
jgi:hypothetical protein